MPRPTRRPDAVPPPGPREGSPAPDQGSAMVIVLGVTMILVLVASLSATVAIRAAATARHSTAWNQALAAAEAGVDDYLARLNQDEGYWQTIDCANPALRRPGVSECGWGASTARGWAPVPGADRAEFHYQAQTESAAVNGTVRLTSTGRVGRTTRSVQTVLRRGGFGEFLYYTVHEQVDPANDATYSGPPKRTTAWAQANCVRYWWATPAPHSDCVEIQFAGGDVINGPMHTNDRILTGGAVQFKGETSTSWPACDRPPASRTCYQKASGANPVFTKGIRYRPPVELPTTAGDLRQYVDPARTPDPGCLYTGPTRIRLTATTATHSTMEVWSPYSRGVLNPGCGTFTASDPKETLTLPHNSLVIVQDIPTGGPAPASRPNGSCAVGTIGGLPIANDVNENLADANCRYGTLYLEGTLKGRVTFVADNNIVVTDHLRYHGGKTGNDALGLIASNSVKIYHPVNSAGTNLARPDGKGVFSNATVHAAILTLQHSFVVQSWDKGAGLGRLSLFGSFAQRYRGPVATTGGTGYDKDYEYDTRLRYAPPPYMLDPVRSSWGIKAYGEVPAP